MRRLDDRSIDLAPNEILGFAKIRNENLRLPWFLDFHRRLGVSRFFIADNASTDGSTEYLLECGDVHLFWTSDSFGDNRGGMNWLNQLLDDYAPGHWTVTLDPDELLVYPSYERVNLVQLVAFLDQAGADALACMMIDMYGPSAIEDTRYFRTQDFLEVCPYFDPEPPRNMRGGARKRLFWDNPQNKSKSPPYLGKTPLVRWEPGRRFEASTHTISDVRLSPMQGALLHFKLFSDFHDRVAAAIEEGEHWDGCSEYKAYQAALDANPALVPYYDKSVCFENSAQLMELGFMASAPEYDEFVCRERDP